MDLSLLTLDIQIGGSHIPHSEKASEHPTTSKTGRCAICCTATSRMNRASITTYNVSVYICIRLSVYLYICVSMYLCTYVSIPCNVSEPVSLCVHVLYATSDHNPGNVGFRIVKYHRRSWDICRDFNVEFIKTMLSGRLCSQDWHRGIPFVFRNRRCRKECPREW